MRIIPVLDLKGGVVVRGVRGERAAYRPIETTLAEGSEPVAVLEGLMRLGAFGTVYIADLDAIESGTPDDAAVRRLGEAFPRLGVWVDRGVRDAEDIQGGSWDGQTAPVVGSETLLDRAVLDDPAIRRGAVLSLDFRGAAFLGDPAVLNDAALWPERLIVMTLARVGSGAGPDLERLHAVIARAGGRKVYAAGGVRGSADLHALAAIGCAGVLVASALHDGRLSADEIAEFVELAG